MKNGRSQIGAFQARRRAWSAEPDVYKTGATPFGSLPVGEIVSPKLYA
jgi:hypothetical protein